MKYPLGGGGGYHFAPLLNFPLRLVKILLSSNNIVGNN